MNNIHAEVDEILRTGNKKAIVSLFLSMQGNYIRATEAEARLAKAQAEIERLNKGIKVVQSAFKNYKNADANVARITLREAQILSASCSPDAVNSERAANEILTEELERKDKLIEQMRSALGRIADELEPSEHDIRGCMFKACKWCDARAAIKAAKGEI